MNKEDLMNRILERSMFLIIGALIATVAYLIGNADRDADAQDEFARFDKIICRGIFLTNEDNTNGIELFFDETGSPKIFLRDKKSGEKISLGVVNNGPLILVEGDQEGEFLGIGINSKEGRASMEISGSGERGGSVSLGTFQGHGQLLISTRDRQLVHIPGVSLVSGPGVSGIHVEGKIIAGETQSAPSQRSR